MLQNETIRLEKEYEDQSLVQNIFRAAHTLKGSSGMIGHTRMANLTHAMESVLDMVRKGNLIPTSEIVDTILSSLDGLSILREEVATKEESDVDLSGVVAALHAIIDSGASKTAAPAPAAPVAAGVPDAAVSSEPGSSAALPSAPNGSGNDLFDRFPLTDAEKAALLQKMADGTGAWLVEAELQPDSPWLAVRAFQILTDAGALGEIFASLPSKTDVEEEKVGPRMQVILLTREDEAKIAEAVSTIEDVVSQSSTAYSLQDFTPPAAPPPAQPPTADPSPTSSPPVAVTPAPRELAPAAPARGKASPALLEMPGQKVEKMAQNVRVDVERLDTLMNLVGELVIDRTRLQQIGTQLEAELGVHDSLDALNEAAQHVGRITDELQEEVMRIRMLPIENVFNKFPRLVRSLAQQLEKKIDFVVEGKETELDRSVIEKIDDPIIHLLRNSVDHGIESPEERRNAGKPETGTIRLSAWHEENHIVISVQDDGHGMNPDILRASAVRKGLITQEMAERMDDRAAVDLIFAPGFSTAAKTTDVSGRGVGMDIVRANIEKLSGFVSIETAVGRGTRFLVKLPLTLAIIRALLVSVAGQKFAIPMSTVVETLRFDAQDVRTVKLHEAIQLRGAILPLASLRDLFAIQPVLSAGMDQDSGYGANFGLGDSGLFGGAETIVVNGARRPRDKLFVVAVRVGDRQMGLEVDSLIGETEIVIKPLSRFVGDVHGISGVTILGDGQVAIICDVPSLINRVVKEQLLA